MARQLVLLAGLHKTATTSIQETCRSNGQALMDAGLWYPIVSWDEQQLANHTRLLNRLFRSEPHTAGLGNQYTLGDRAAALRGRDDFREKFFGALEAAPCVVCAAEGVSVWTEEELVAMRDWLLARQWTIRVICNVRRLSGWLNSVVSQRVTSPIRLSLPAALDEFVTYGGGFVRPRLERLRRVFPATEFCSHEEALLHANGPVGAFLERIGFRSQGTLAFKRANEGRSDCATRLMSVINERFGPFDADGRGNPREFNDPGLLTQVIRMGGPKFALRSGEAARYMPRLEAENRWLRDTLGPAFFDPALRFTDEPVSCAPELVDQVRALARQMPPPVRAWVEQNFAGLGVGPPDAPQGAAA